MCLKKLSKLSAFLLLMVVVNMSMAETTVDPLAKDDTLQDLNTNDIISENFNLDKGSGVETTTILGDETSIINEKPAEVGNATESENNNEVINITESPNNGASNTEPITESTTNKIECVCDCIANGNQVTLDCSTKSPGETQTETTASSEGQTSSNNESTLPTAETTVPLVEEKTSIDSIITEITSESNAEAATTTQTTTVAPPPVCSTPGVQANELDCKQYYDCSLEESIDGIFHLLTKSCPNKQAFNIELNRCSRDISSCSFLPIQCLVKGGLSDPASNSSYYLCEPRLIGVGFRIFHVDCASNEIFYPELGKCFIDFNNLPTQGYQPFNWNQIRDIDIVKAELKLLKEQDKSKLKQEKERKKAEEKLQKELEKDAKKKAKEEQKVNKEKAKMQAANVVCLHEGNIASEIGDNIYYACITKKGKLKAIPMQCSFGAKFNPETGSCINATTGVNSSVSAEDDEDD